MKTTDLDPQVVQLIESNQKEIGQLIRKLRNEQGLRLRDLGDGEASSSTISKVERGVGKFKLDRVVYLLEKLGVPLANISDILDQERKNTSLIEIQLRSVETLLRFGQYKKALYHLERKSINEAHYLAPTYYYLKGKCLIGFGNLDQAEKTFLHTIKLLEDESKEDNIEAACYAELSFCKDCQNDIQEALCLTDKGISSFVPDGDRQHIIYALYLNKSLYCYKMNKSEGILALDYLESSLDQIQDPNVQLVYYWLKASHTRKSGKLTEALQYAEKGLRLAGMAKSYNMMLEFWLCIGDCFFSMGNFEEAEHHFELALEFDEKQINRPEAVSFIYLKLGKLYLEQKLWDKALPFVSKACKTATDNNDAHSLVHALLLSGDIALNLDNHSSAVQYYQQAQVLSHQHSFKIQEYKAWSRLADSWHPVNQVEYQLCATQAFELQKSANLKGDYYDDDEIL
ncbi:tetratricopeptide repeat protein [Thermoactinomyces sp. DSM 45892]|uniref:helix-turn-helix domain-containing protein n=1 Tax=Thermoactinomyces sp. DSM 45892 TaxID=1882753 RepID=UPI0008958B9A|nr:tetratricopeptide repeat protein [Thermoactinomyces sp. DSM 45892]SDZ01253.1 Tetratricopeptide repeat-containing protein [Thermoactinomyces sp. DSM 45892]